MMDTLKAIGGLLLFMGIVALIVYMAVTYFTYTRQPNSIHLDDIQNHLIKLKNAETNNLYNYSDNTVWDYDGENLTNGEIVSDASLIAVNKDPAVVSLVNSTGYVGDHKFLIDKWSNLSLMPKQREKWYVLRAD